MAPDLSFFGSGCLGGVLASVLSEVLVHAAVEQVLDLGGAVGS